ncbi:MAG: prepilin peptidase [Candidatus Rokubacteria bacterium]|nr:prepilin peptidase [Candidatus Rokubacteria bacterium]
MLTWPVVVVVAALLGSFLNVCISRLPRGESVVSPPSHCPRCDAPIRYYDNLPLVSFALLGGRCRACREPISWRYPIVEALAAAVGFLAFWQLGPTWAGLRAFVLGLALIAITFIDLETLLIPDRITLPGIVIGLGLSLVPSPRALVWALIGCLVAGGLFYAIAALSRGGMGGGDIKLAAMLGAFLGWPLVVLAIFAAVVLGGVVALGLLASGRRGRKDAVPFGPFLAFGGLLTALWGRPVLAWYLG